MSIPIVQVTVNLTVNVSAFIGNGYLSNTQPGSRWVFGITRCFGVCQSARKNGGKQSDRRKREKIGGSGETLSFARLARIPRIICDVHFAID